MDTLQFWINEFNVRVGKLNSLLQITGTVLIRLLARHKDMVDARIAWRGF